MPGINIGKNLGTLLRESFGAQYYALGLAFGKGSFKAADSAATGAPIRDFDAGLPSQYSLDWYLSLPSKGSYLIDLRRPPKTKIVSEWLNKFWGLRAADFRFSDGQINQWQQSIGLLPLRLSEMADGIIFIDKTTGVHRG